MAEERIRDAKALLDGGRWEFAYYVAGYAVECGLKSCLLARMVLTGWVFQEKWKADRCLTHDFDELIELADLKKDRDAEMQRSAAAGGDFSRRWNEVVKWKVTSRYEPKTEVEARALYDSITDAQNGVLPWIKNIW